jgi:hypothetical protein
MSAREGIMLAELIKAINARDGVVDIESILRSHGWLHEDDVVEGKTIASMCKVKPESQAFQMGKCIAKPNTACVDCSEYVPERPATVQDLIGGE